MLPNIAGFSYVYISQGSVATQLRCGGIFNNHLITNCPLNWAMKKFENLLTFGEDMDNKSATFFWSTLTVYSVIPGNLITRQSIVNF